MRKCSGLTSLNLGTHLSLVQLYFGWTNAAFRAVAINEAHAERANLNTNVNLYVQGTGTPSAPELANIAVLEAGPHNWNVTNDP